jgi:flagellar motor switch protein FliN/FliY
VSTREFGAQEQDAAAKGAASLEALLDVSMPIVVEIGRTTMTVQEILSLGVGSVVQLERLVGDPVDVFVGDRRFGVGEIVVVGDHFGVRIVSLHAPASLERAA